MHLFSTITLAACGAQAYKTFGAQPQISKKYHQEFRDRYSPLKVLGGLGPYSERSGYGISTDTPNGCVVDQVVAVTRHGERYPDPSNAEGEVAVLRKIRAAHPEPFTGDLAFFNDWTYYMDEDTLNIAGLEAREGPYSGISDLLEYGSAFRGKYGNLWDGVSPLPIWSSDSERVVNSARAFGEGFLGYNYTDLAELNILPEWESVGANTLSVAYCDIEGDNIDEEQCGGDALFPLFDVAAQRLNREYNLGLNASDIQYLLEITAFETAIRGDSPWLNSVFTADELLAFNYARSVGFYCSTGPGTQSGQAIGASFFNATSRLLNEGPNRSHPLALNFAHDSDIVAMLAGAGILIPTRNLTTQRIVFDTNYDVSDIVPMGARLVIERLNCEAPYLTNTTDLVDANYTVGSSQLNQTIYPPVGNNTGNITGYYPVNSTNATATAEPSLFVRVLLNGAVIPLEFGYEGPGFSISLSDFTEYIAERVQQHNYSEVCRPDLAGVPAVPTYWWSYNQTTTYNLQNSTIGYQQYEVFN